MSQPDAGSFCMCVCVFLVKIINSFLLQDIYNATLSQLVILLMFIIP
jgi:hypothetical protein